jgi:hypothetical protein
VSWLCVHVKAIRSYFIMCGNTTTCNPKGQVDAGEDLEMVKALDSFGMELISGMIAVIYRSMSMKLRK